MIVDHIEDVRSLVAVVRVRRDHWLHTWAMLRMRKTKLRKIMSELVSLPGRPNLTPLDQFTLWCSERDRLGQVFLGHLDLISDDIPKVLCKILKHCISYFHDSCLPLESENGNTVMVGGSKTNFMGIEWLIEVSFVPADNSISSQGHEVVIRQNVLVHSSNSIGETLQAFFQAFKFRTSLLRRTGDGRWDDNIYDQDYIQDASDSEDEWDSEGESEDCPHCGYVAAVCKCEYCPLCRCGIGYCLCDFCSVCRFAVDDCICV